MVAQVIDGWLHGSLPDDTGREWPILRFNQTDQGQGPIVVETPNLVLHTTETSGYVEHLQFPSQFQCGEGVIGQHVRLGMSGDALRTWDRHCRDIEMVGRSQVGVWLPAEATLGPAVALTAWLHKTDRIKTGLVRPTPSWPLHVDQLPAAVEAYYRRHAGLWPDKPGVYGHIEIPDNTHWDPGGFNYTRFFQRVRDTLGGDEVAFSDFKQGVRDARLDRPLPADANADYEFGWRMETRATSQPAPGAHAHPEKADEGHQHDVVGKTS